MALLVVVASCSSTSENATGDAPARTVTPTTISTTAPDVEPVQVPPDGTCEVIPRFPSADVGTVNTIVVPANAEDFEVGIVATPASACPGDTVRFTVTVRNAADHASLFAPNRGLLLASGMMANWPLGSLGPVELAAGEAWVTTLDAVVPGVPPSVYQLLPEGIPADGSLTVLDPGRGYG